MAVPFRLDPVDDQFKSLMLANIDQVSRATNRASREAARRIKARGDVDIRSSGRFSKRWTDAFTVDGAPTRDDNTKTIELTVYSKISYGHVFEFTPTTIRGRPMLWIPLSFTGIKERARDWGRKNGGLFRVDRKNGKAPLLLSVRDGKPKFFGKEQVTLRTKFHIRDICKRVMAGYADLYAKYFGA
jgi:hypothetical protein